MLNKNGGYDGFTLPSMWYEYGGFCTGIGMSTIDVFSELINKKTDKSQDQNREKDLMASRENGDDEN